MNSPASQPKLWRRAAVLGRCTALWGATLVLALTAFGQPRQRVVPSFTVPGVLNREEGEAALAAFRQYRFDGDFALRARLRETRRGQPDRYLDAFLWGGQRGDQTRIAMLIFTSQDPEIKPLALMWHNGSLPSVWLAGDNGHKARPIGSESMHLPLPGLGFLTPFEIGLPFVQWREWVYEGPLRSRGRPAHRFLLLPPAGETAAGAPEAVRLTLDADFHALLRAELLGEGGRLVRSLRLGSLKKIEGRWLIRQLDYVDAGAGGRWRLEIDSAALGLTLPESAWEAERWTDRPSFWETLSWRELPND